MNNRLIALDKNPGVRPIGIGEVSRRLIAKSILRVVKSDILEAAGCCSFVQVSEEVVRLQFMPCMKSTRILILREFVGGCL